MHSKLIQMCSNKIKGVQNLLKIIRMYKKCVEMYSKHVQICLNIVLCVRNLFKYKQFCPGQHHVKEQVLSFENVREKQK